MQKSTPWFRLLPGMDNVSHRVSTSGDRPVARSL
jgi:hypothetical protein